MPTADDPIPEQEEQLPIGALAAPVPRPRRWAWVVAWLVATTLLVICFRLVGVSRMLEIASRLHPAWVAASLVSNLGIQLSAAMMWRLLLPPGFQVPYARLFAVMIVGSLVMNTAPMLVGHASIAIMLGRTRGVGNAAALSVLALDQLVEGLSKLVVIGLALALAPVPDWLRTGAAALGGVMILLLATLFVIARRHHDIGRWAKEGNKLQQLAASWAHHLETLRQPRRFALAWMASLGMKVCEFGGIVAVQHALGLHIPLGHSVLVLAAVGLGTILPVTPGNIGTYEAVTLLAYRWLGLGAQEALAVALVQHISYLVAGTTPGYVSVTLRQFRRGKAVRV